MSNKSVAEQANDRMKRRRAVDEWGMTGREALFFAMLNGKGDVSILRLYTGYYGEDPEAKGHYTSRRQQQALSWIMSQVNLKLAIHDLEIRPGQLRGTYRVYPKD